MKILFIGTTEFDYLQDLTYNGLIKVLGKKNVIEYKINPRYHFPLKKYPKNIGYNGLDFSFLTTRFVRDFNCVIVPAAKPKCFELYENLLPKLKSSVKTVFIDGGDWPAIGGDLTRLNNDEIYNRINSKRPFDLIFKREYYKNKIYEKHVYPLPFSINNKMFSLIPSMPFKYDVSFWAVESHPIRTEELNFLENRFDCADNGTSHNQTLRNYKRKGKFYFEELKRCRILLNFRGGGWDTLRFWEILGLQRFMISQQLEIVIPNDFEKDSEIVYCNNELSDLEELCKYYLKNEAISEQIAKNAYNKAMNFHTDEARARYILDIIQN
jgi:hypothetical protein